MKTERPSPFDQFYQGLLGVHDELRRSVEKIVAAVDDDSTEAANTDLLIDTFCERLDNHHRSEDVFFFPAFRAAGRLKSADIAFLDARDDEHVAIVRLSQELQRITQRHRSNLMRPADWRRSVVHLCEELNAVALPHFHDEEAVLTPTHVAQMISARQLVAVYRDMGQNWNRR